MLRTSHWTAPQTRGFVRAVFVGCVCLLALACASDTEAAPARACDLMTESDVEDVYGIRVEGEEQSEDQETGWLTRCIYATPEGQIRLLVQEMESEAAAEDQYATFLESFNGTEDVDGVGDAAIWIPETQQLIVRLGDTYFALTSAIPGAEEAQAVEMGGRIVTGLEGET